MNSAKELLTKYNILGSALQDGKKHPKHEFQAYGYKLAADLNDLVNLPIYLRLAKNVERTILEKAYGFVIDAQSSEKGRLFLWKVKQIRKEIQKRKDLNNFDYKFVTNKMKKFRDEFTNTIFAKGEKEFDDNKKFLLEEILLKELDIKSKTKILAYGTSSAKMANIFHALNCKIEFVDLSKKFVEELKSKVGLKKNIKYYSADLLIKKFKPNSFDYIIINSLWNIVPQESELKMFVKLQDILKEDGAIVFMLKEDLQDSQGWFPFGSSDEIYYFTKKTTLKHLREIVDKLGMQVVKERKYLENAAILIRKSLIEQREKSKEKNVGITT